MTTDPPLNSHPRRRLVAALSGGVDSSVAAARAVDAGHEVVGVHLALSPSTNRSAQAGSRGCCTLDDARDARRVADMLDIPFYVWDFSAEFAEDVVADFVAEYESGRTPNPCMRCNERIKFAAVLDRAMALGFDGIVTGHYAQIVHTPTGPQLHRGVDPAKDQSYVLGMLDSRTLALVHLPIGMDDKATVRAEAERRGLGTAAKPDSHDICFIPTGDTAGFLTRRIGERPGTIVDASTGATLGHHAGSYAFTIGQRRGLGLGDAGTPVRRHVVGIDGDTVLVGEPELLDVGSLRGSAVTWTGEPTYGPVDIQVRAHAAAVPGFVEERRDESGSVCLIAHLHTPIRGVAPGQSAVFYSGTRVVGSMIIDEATSLVPRHDGSPWHG